MKTILRTLVILLVVVTVSGGVYALVESTSLVSSIEAERGAPSQMIGADAQSLPNHPEGGNDHDASLSHGISQVFVTLAKLTAITLVILFFQKGIDLLKKMKLKVVQR